MHVNAHAFTHIYNNLFFLDQGYRQVRSFFYERPMKDNLPKKVTSSILILFLGS